MEEIAYQSAGNALPMGIRQRGQSAGNDSDAASGLGTYTIPMSKALLFRTKSRKNNPEGRSILRNAYRSWYFKRRIQEIEGIGIERDLAGLPVMHGPEGLDLWNDDIEDKDRKSVV